MPAFITERPEKIISGNTSRWNAVTNPVIFTTERRDVNILFVTESNGQIRIQMIGNQQLTPFNLEIGDRVYIKSGPYDVVGTIQSHSPGAFTLDIPFSSNSSGGYVNFLTKRTNYRIQARILKVFNNLYETIVTTGQFRMDEKGIAKIDISAWLRTLPKMINEFNYDKLNEADPNLGGNYIFQIRELYSDPASDFAGVFPDPAFDNLNYFVNAARQIQSEHGGNMAQFVPFSIDVDEAEKALFLSGFTEPSRFVGYPFDLQFIFSDNIGSLLITKEERSFDINSTQQDSNSNELNNSQKEQVNRLILKEGYDPLAVKLSLWLSIDILSTVDDIYAEEDYVDESYDQGGYSEEPDAPLKKV